MVESMVAMRGLRPVKFGVAVRMELLWLAIVFYSIGLGVILYLRPAVMFNENGTWKEFGYQRDSRYTIFPVWLFIITWAIVSYVLSMVVSSYVLHIGGLTAAATATAAFTEPSSAAHSFATRMFSQPEAESDSEEEDIITMPDPPKKRRTSAVMRSNELEKEKPRPGYYVLEPNGGSKGLRKYVYYGPSPPAD